MLLTNSNLKVSQNLATTLSAKKLEGSINTTRYMWNRKNKSFIKKHTFFRWEDDVISWHPLEYRLLKWRFGNKHWFIFYFNKISEICLKLVKHCNGKIPLVHNRSDGYSTDTASDRDWGFTWWTERHTVLTTLNRIIYLQCESLKRQEGGKCLLTRTITHIKHFTPTHEK